MPGAAMKVVMVLNSFPADHSHFTALSGAIDLTVYGSELNPGYQYRVEPPQSVPHRSFDPPLPTISGLLWYYPGLGRALERDRPNVLHVISEPWGLYAVQAASWARRHPDTALVIHGCARLWSHGAPPKRLARNLLARFSLARADAYAGESARAVELTREHGLPPPAATAVIHTNTRDPALLRPAADETERIASREQLGLPTHGAGVGFLGRLAPEKGPLHLLEALREAPKALRRDAWFAMAGTGPLRREVSRRAAEANVTYLGSLRYPDEVACFLRSVDVLVAPSMRTAEHEEQGGRALVEAMMSGCVVVGTAVGGIPETVGEAGILASEGDPADLAEAIARAVGRASNQRIRRHIREQAVARFSGGAVAASLSDLWERALSTPRQGRCSSASPSTLASVGGGR